MTEYCRLFMEKVNFILFNNSLCLLNHLSKI
jgi:hypothetical protein